jgi:hypothetical protein
MRTEVVMRNLKPVGGSGGRARRNTGQKADATVVARILTSSPDGGDGIMVGAFWKGIAG